MQAITKKQQKKELILKQSNAAIVIQTTIFFPFAQSVEMNTISFHQ